jgi:putative oxygen-independent coproporphyrinogen III oxidase
LTPAPPLGVYIHWPYCERICPYCDFNVRRDRGPSPEKVALAVAIGRDLVAQSALIDPRSLVSIYFGGGTPSLMDPDSVAAIIAQAAALWAPVQALEITLEANPTDAEAERFARFALTGVNRLSLGVQSLRDASLRFLGRNHSAAMGRRAVEIALQAVPRVSIDLIYALPGQGVHAWASELREAVALGAEHISAYQLTIEPGTAFARAAGRGVLRPAQAEAAADLFEATQSVLGEAGFEAYEVSNHARRPQARSRHNLIYWRGEDYVGVGPGAHGRLTIDAERWERAAPCGTAQYIAAVKDGAIAPRRLDRLEAAEERLLMGLRTSEGIALSELASPERAAPKLEALVAAGLVEVAGDRLSVLPAGRLVLDRITLDLADGA